VPVAIVAGRRARILEHSCAENDVNDQNVRSATHKSTRRAQAITVLKNRLPPAQSWAALSMIVVDLCCYDDTDPPRSWDGTQLGGDPRHRTSTVITDRHPAWPL